MTNIALDVSIVIVEVLKGNKVLHKYDQLLVKSLR